MCICTELAMYLRQKSYTYHIHIQCDSMQLFCDALYSSDHDRYKIIFLDAFMLDKY